jgi:hypothetical protein
MLARVDGLKDHFYIILAPKRSRTESYQKALKIFLKALGTPLFY